MSARAASSIDTPCPPPFSMAQPSAPDRCAECRQPTSKRWSSCRFASNLKPSQEIDDRSLVQTHVARVEVQPEQLVIQLAETQRSDRQKVGSNAALKVAWQKTI